MASFLRASRSAEDSAATSLSAAADSLAGSLSAGADSTAVQAGTQFFFFAPYFFFAVLGGLACAGLAVVTFGPEEDPLDRDPCCGTHVDHTGRLGLLLILGCERGRKGELRISFAAGGRAVAAARTRLDALGQTSHTLTTGFRELPERAQKLLGQVKQLSRELKRARGAALTLEAEAAARSSDAAVVTRALSEGEPGQLRAWANAFLAARRR